MPEFKYADRIITDAKTTSREICDKVQSQKTAMKSTLESTHLLTVDGSRIKDFFYVDCRWFWQGSTTEAIDEPHTHEFDEVLGFVGSDRHDPHSLGGEITIWLNNEKQTLAKSSLIFIPAGLRHGPVRFDRIDTPIFMVAIAPTGHYSRLRMENSNKSVTGSGEASESISNPDTPLLRKPRPDSLLRAPALPPLHATPRWLAHVSCTSKMTWLKGLSMSTSSGYTKVTAGPRPLNTPINGWS